ncbi:hypothetical protein LINPERHAP1_LOCUS34631 [Linum perenne]
MAQSEEDMELRRQEDVFAIILDGSWMPSPAILDVAP